MPMTPARRRLLVTLASCALLAAIVIGFRAVVTEMGPPPPPRTTTPDGWLVSLPAALEVAAETHRPLLLLWGRTTPDRYERALRDDSTVRGADVVRCRVDVATDTPAAERLRVRRHPATGEWLVPTLLLLDTAGVEITRLEGRREIDEVARMVGRGLETPVPRAVLEARAAEDVGAARRLVEVMIESAEPDSALRAAEDLARRSDAAADSLLVAKALVGAGRLEAGAACAAAAAEADTALAPEARWVRIVALMNLGRDREAARAVEEALAADDSSAFARRIVLAYGIEYLVRGKEDLRGGIAFLEGFIRAHPSSPFLADALLAVAPLHGLAPGGAERAIERFGRALETGDARTVEAAEEMLVDWATRTGRAGRAAAVLRPRLEAAAEADRPRILFHVAALEAAEGETAAAIEHWRSVADGESDRADDALLALSLYRLDGEASIDSAVALLEEHRARFGDRETAVAARFHLGRARIFQGRFEEADASLAPLADRADPFGEEARRYLDLVGEARRDTETAGALVAALVRRARGEVDEAAADLRGLVERAPRSPLADDALLEIAKTSLARRDRAGAERALRRILEEYHTANQYDSARFLLDRIAGRPPR